MTQTTKTTKTYRIESEAGAVLGDYQGADEAEALDAYSRDAGYADYAEVMATVGGTVTVREVDSTQEMRDLGRLEELRRAVAESGNDREREATARGALAQELRGQGDEEGADAQEEQIRALCDDGEVAP
jgi:hypothetical protein